MSGIGGAVTAVVVASRNVAACPVIANAVPDIRPQTRPRAVVALGATVAAVIVAGSVIAGAVALGVPDPGRGTSRCAVAALSGIGATVAAVIVAGSVIAGAVTLGVFDPGQGAS